MPQFDVLVSLGEQCKTAYQLRRYFGTNASNIFDWLVTPAASLLALIESDFDGFFQIDNLKVRADGNGVEDFATGVIFQHGFPRDADGHNTADGIVAGYEQENRKMQHLLGHWRNLSRMQKILFCRSGEYTSVYPEQLLAVLQKRFPIAEIVLLMVSEHQVSRVNQAGNIIERRVPNDAGPFPELWKGNDAGWDPILAQVMGNKDADEKFQLSYFE